jgi:hypothetical protein
MLPALYCRDSLGLAEYWIHDDLANPLLLKLSFLPPEGMKPIESIVELDESDSANAGRDPRLPKLLVKRGSGTGDGGADSPAAQPYQPGYNQFGGPPQLPPDIDRAERVDGGYGYDDSSDLPAEPDQQSEGDADSADAQQGRDSDAGIDTGHSESRTSPGAPSGDYLPPSIDELVACGGGYAIVEIDF